MSRGKYIVVVISILSLALILRAYAPFPADLLGDEATYMFRSVGYLDHMASQLQTTPYQWFATPPWWAKFSFHDHPPFSFALYHVAFRVLGMHTYVVRLIPLVMGLLSVWLVALIAARMGGWRAGINAAALAAAASGMIWISRIALLEAVLIPLMLAAFYACLRAREDRKWWVGAGIYFGLAVITKYTALFLAPALLFAALPAYMNKKNRMPMIMGCVAFVLMISPVIIYNSYLLQTRGHPDYQLSRLLHINTPDWREDFTQGRPFQAAAFLSLLADALSWIALLACASAAAWLAYDCGKRRGGGNGPLLIVLCFLALGSMWIGGSQARFVVPVVPFLCIAAGLAAARLLEGAHGTEKWVWICAITAVLLLSSSYSINTHFMIHPWGESGIAYAKTRMENYGYEQLDQHLLRLYRARASGMDLWEEGRDETLYIYDSDMNYFPRLWHTQRRVTYQGIPFTSSSEFKRLVLEHGEDYFPSRGFAKYVFIYALPGALLIPENVRDTVAAHMAESLRENNVKPAIIPRSDGVPAFEVYEF